MTTENMTAKLSIRCPYRKETGETGYRILMFVYFRETDDDGKIQDRARIQAKKRLKRIRAVEIFSELLDEHEKDLSKISQTESLFLVTSEDESSIEDLEEKDLDPLKNWKFHLYDALDDEIEFKGTLKLKTQSRCPLLPSDEDCIDLDFSFAKPDGVPTTQNNLDCLKKLSSNYGELKVESGAARPVRILFDPNRMDSVDGKPTVLPRLLRFDHFAPGATGGDRAPGGKSHWEVKISNIENAERGINHKKYGLNVGYWKEPGEHGEWWGRKDETALMLFPLNIAPVGVFRVEKFDFCLRLTYPAQNPDEWILKDAEKVGSVWKMQVNSIYDLSFKNNFSFTPLAAWNRCIAEGYYKSLHSVKDGTSGSVVPYFLPATYDDLEPNKASRVWTLCYDVTDKQPFGNADLKQEQFGFTLQSVGIKRDNDPSKTQPLMIDVELRNFLDQNGQVITRRFLLSDYQNIESLCRAKDNDEDENPTENKTLFQFAVKDIIKDKSPQQTSRVGALNLHFATAWEKNESALGTVPLLHELNGTLTAGLRGLETFDFLEFNDPPDDWKTEVERSCKPSVEAEIPLLLAGLSPGGQDPLPQEIADKTERFPGTIIMPLKNSQNGAAEEEEAGGFIRGLFALVANEKCQSQENQNLALRLEKVNKGVTTQEANSSTGSKINFIVIDQQPFLVARVNAQVSFADEVGNWDDAESFWELEDEGKSFDLIMPPQAVGEEFIKDYKNFRDANQPSDPTKPFRLRYKFSPPAVFKIMRSNERQNFTETPWNLRRLLGYIKGRERGAGIEQLEYELLFGLTTTVKTDFLRLSELSGRLGHLPDSLGGSAPLKIEGGFVEKSPDICDVFLKEYSELRQTFRRQKTLLQSRLALFYPFSVAQKARFLTLDSGVDFRFRTTREVVHPIDEKISNGIFKRLDEGGLRGGVDWGFESGNIHTEVINSKTSSSGKIVAPSFTALGGSGYQKASFALDKSTIYSNTFLGRTFFYSLERIGRIGVLWNRAKHVIVYERTVADTEQFDDKNEIWRGIPAVRKVTEYVEILQPERGYPEFGEAPKVRGFVLGSKFEPHARIPVDSKWGRDITGGWVVPLYNPAAEKEKPTVYPSPNIHLKIATAEETGKAQTWGRILNPEDLYFYTSTNPNDDANTDEWAAVPEIDYPLDDVPRPPAGIETHVGGAMDATLPDPPRTEGGYAPFTFHLDTNRQTANLLADRLQSSVEAVVENVSLARRKLENFQFDGDSKKIREAVERATQNYRNQVETEIGGALEKIADGGTAAVAEIERLKTSIETKIDTAQAELKNAGRGTLEIFQKAQNDLETNWREAWQKTADKVSAAILNSQSPAEANDFLFDLKRQIAAAEFALNETRMRLQSVLDAIDNLTQNFSPPTPNIKNQLQAEIRAIKNRLASEVKRIVAEVDNTALGEAEKLKAKKGRIVAAAVNEFNRWQKFLNELRAETETLIPDFWQGVEAKAIALIDALVAPVLTNEQTFKDWLNNIETLFRGYESWLIDLRDKIKSPIEAVKAPFDLINDECTKLENILASEVDKIEELEKKPLAEIKASIEGVISAAKKRIEDEFFDAAKNAFKDLPTNQIKDAINQVHGEIDGVAASVKNEIETATNIAKAVADKLQNDLTDETRRAVQSATEALMGNATKILAPFEKQLRDEARRIDLGVGGDLEKAKAAGERTLRLVRAYGEAPVAEALKLNRERLAYYYGELNEGLSELKNSVAYTPATVLMNRVGRELENLDLKTLGVRLPSKELVEKFVADNLPKFDLKDILPDFAGMKLEKFFSGVKIPQGVKDAVNVSHGIDKQTNRAWAKCDVVMPLDKPVSLFNFGAVEARLVKAHFEAHTSMSADLMNPDRIEKYAEGAITADWHLLILGQIVLTLEKSTLRFDKNGKLKFEMQPASIKLATALQFISDLVRSFSPGKKSGLSFELVTDGMLPVGVRAVLNLPLPPLQTGSFAVSHIALRSRFEVAAPNGKFYVGLGLSLSSKERPFTLTVLCLGGGGWLDVLTMYRPFEETGKLQSRLSIGLAAGADFTFDIGVAAGTVYFLVSLYAEYTVGGGNNQLRIALRLTQAGEVSVLGIVSVNVTVYYEASYESDGSMKCTGNFSVSIEICWCFTLDVDQDVEFTIAGGSGGNTRALAETDEVGPAVSEYVSSYGE